MSMLGFPFYGINKAVDCEAVMAGLVLTEQDKKEWAQWLIGQTEIFSDEVFEICAVNFDMLQAVGYDTFAITVSCERHLFDHSIGFADPWLIVSKQMLEERRFDRYKLCVQEGMFIVDELTIGEEVLKEL